MIAFHSLKKTDDSKSYDNCLLFSHFLTDFASTLKSRMNHDTFGGENEGNFRRFLLQKSPLFTHLREIFKKHIFHFKLTFFDLK